MSFLALFSVAAAAEPRFVIPDGWRDLSPGAPRQNEAGVPAQTLVEARRPNVVAYGADLAGAADGFIENVSVVLVEGTLSTRTALRELPRSYPLQCGDLGAEDCRISEVREVTVDGQPGIRAVGHIRFGAVQVATLQYLLPAGDRTALLTYTSTAKDLERYLPTFDAAARATTGLAAPTPRWARVGDLAVRIPDGWLDLSPGAPASRFEGLPPDWVAKARDPMVAAWAVNVDGAFDDGPPETLNVRIEPGRIDVHRVAAEMETSSDPMMRVSWAVVSRLGGVDVVQMRATYSMNIGTFECLQYMVPLGDRHAVMTYTAPPDSMEWYRPVFEAAAAETRWVGGATSPGR